MVSVDWPHSKWAGVPVELAVLAQQDYAGRWVDTEAVR